MDSRFSGQPMTEFNTSSFNPRGGAILHLYSPRIMGNQVLRPYSYAITGNAVDKLACGGKTMSESLSRREIALDPEVAGSIKPVSNGVELDMSVTNELWTFVLQVDLTSPFLGGHSTNGAVVRRRIMYSGVCLDEPINQLTMWNGEPTLNDNCPLRFTHATETVVDPSVGGMGAHDRVMVRSDIDVVDRALDGQANNVDLYLSTPDRLLKSTDNETGITTHGLNCVSNLTKGTGVVTTLKAPLAHLRTLLMGLDQQVALCESSAGSTISNHMSGAVDIFDVNAFKEGVASEWTQMSSSLGTTSGMIDAGDIVLLGYIHQNYPDILVIPYNISRYSPVAEQFGECDQRAINPRTVYSSMVAAAVSALANNFGFSLIDFSYDSYCGQFGSNSMGTYQVSDAHLAMPPSDPDSARELLSHALEMFRRQIMLDLVPSLKAQGCGDFQMNVRYMCNAETLVDLNFYDYSSLSNGGIYETTNRIANVGSTSVGTQDHFMNNGAVLDSFVHSVYGRNMKNQFGVAAFGHDAGDILNSCEMESAGRGTY